MLKDYTEKNCSVVISAGSEDEAYDYILYKLENNPTAEFYFDPDKEEATIYWNENSYTEITSDKLATLSQNDITVKELLDVWWNSVRINIDGEEAILYKTYKGEYELDLSHNSYGEDILNQEVTTSDEFDTDGDGYPIIRAVLNKQIINNAKKEDIIDWLSNHETAFNDAINYFEQIKNSDEEYDFQNVDKYTLIDWISDHELLFNDFKNYFYEI